MIFNSNSNTSFTELVQIATDDQSNPNEIVSSFTLNNNFISASFHDDFFNAAEIIIALFNKSNESIIELRFRGVNHFSNWFQAENLISSSLWNISQISQSDNFTFGYRGNKFRFEINKNRISVQNDGNLAYFSIECPLDVGNFCNIFYSNSQQPVLPNGLKIARSLAIFGKKYIYQNWRLIFRYSFDPNLIAFEQFFFNDSAVGFDQTWYRKESCLFKDLNFKWLIFATDCVEIWFDDIERRVLCLYDDLMSLDGIFNFMNVTNQKLIEIYHYSGIRLLSYATSCNLQFELFFQEGSLNEGTTQSNHCDIEEIYRHHNFKIFLYFSMRYIKILLLDGLDVVQSLLVDDFYYMNNLHSPVYVKAASSWNLTVLRQYDLLILDSDDANETFLSIFKQNANCSLDFGFLTGSCKKRCHNNLSQSSNGSIGSNNDCEIRYTENDNGDLVSNFKTASKIEIYIVDYFYPSTFYTVFRVDAFCGIDIYKYFKTGIVTPAHDGISSDMDHSRFYRHPELLKKLYADTEVKLLIYNFEGQKVILQNTFLTQASADKWIASWHSISHWNKPNKAEDVVNLGNGFSSFLTFSFYDDKVGYEEFCDRAIYFTAVSVNETKKESTGKCDLKSWWLHEQVLKSAIKSGIKNRPPAFFYSDKSDPKPAKDLKLSGKIELQVIDSSYHYFYYG